MLKKQLVLSALIFGSLLLSQELKAENTSEISEFQAPQVSEECIMRLSSPSFSADGISLTSNYLREISEAFSGKNQKQIILLKKGQAGALSFAGDNNSLLHIERLFRASDTTAAVTVISDVGGISAKKYTIDLQGWSPYVWNIRGEVQSSGHHIVIPVEKAGAKALLVADTSNVQASKILEINENLNLIRDVVVADGAIFILANQILTRYPLNGDLNQLALAFRQPSTNFTGPKKIIRNGEETFISYGDKIVQYSFEFDKDGKRLNPKRTYSSNLLNIAKGLHLAVAQNVNKDRFLIAMDQVGDLEVFDIKNMATLNAIAQFKTEIGSAVGLAVYQNLVFVAGTKGVKALDLMRGTVTSVASPGQVDDIRVVGKTLQILFNDNGNRGLNLVPIPK